MQRVSKGCTSAQLLRHPVEESTACAASEQRGPCWQRSNETGQLEESGQLEETEQQGARDMTLDAAMLRRCAEHCATFLDGSVDAECGCAHTGMTWSVAEAVSHMGQGLLWYSSDFAGGPEELSSVDVKVHPSSTNFRAGPHLEDGVVGPLRRGCDHRGRMAGLAPVRRRRFFGVRRYGL